jgi:Flp pilus assembly protein TadD
MSKPIRFGATVSAIAAASMLAACAAPQVKTGFGGKSADVDVGVATRALAALNSNDIPLAIELGERAVTKDPQDAGFRALLGNAYFAAGRFLSAESAFKDSLTIYSNQPRVVLKLALVETALGKNAQAVSFLQAARDVLDPADYGLALALAGQPGEAVAVLDSAARGPGADARVRQNLALAHALAGEWVEARTIAAQDVPASQLDARIEQWMQLAGPAKPGDRVAALIGVTPAAVDNGQPMRLALRQGDTLLAQAAPASVPVAQAAPEPPARTVEAAPLPVPAPIAPKFVEAVAPAAPAPLLVPAIAAAPKPAPQPVIALAPAAAPSATPGPAIVEAAITTPSVAAAPTPSLVSAPVAMALVASVPQAPAAFVPFMPAKAPRAPKVAKPRLISAVAAVAPRPRLRNGDSVMQLGAYRSPAQVSQAWARLTQRYPALRAYFPLRARFDSPKGTFWRLSVQGFESERDAVLRCRTLKARGGQCFVRDFAGDAPVQIASR